MEFDAPKESEFKIPQPDEISKREKDDAMGAYLMMFASWGLGAPLPVVNLIAAVIYHFVNYKKSRFVAFHSLQSLYTQVVLTLFNAGLVYWIVDEVLSAEGYNPFFGPDFFIYMWFVILINLIYIVFSFIALAHARQGRFYYFWIVGRVVFTKFYGPNAVSFETQVPDNKPPEGF